MITERVPMAETKRRFSELVSRGACAYEHIVITRRGKPVAALVSMDDLAVFENLERSRKLAALSGQWDDTAEVAETAEEAYRSRTEQGGGRDVSF